MRDAVKKLLMAAQQARHAHVATLTLAILAALCTAWGPAAATYAKYSLGHSWQIDIDTSLIRNGLLKAPHFLDTLKWWTGRWVMDETAYYRPLTSTAFWLEWKAFGEREWLYVYSTIAAHLIAAALFAALGYRLAEKLDLSPPAIAGLAAAIGFSGLLSPLRLQIVERMMLWKNQPDLWATACCFASMLCYLRALGEKRGLLAACAWYLAACGFKESAVPLPAVCMTFEFLGPRLSTAKEKLRRVALLALCEALFLAVRHLAIGGIGYAPFSNEGWLQRTLMYFAGPFDSWLVAGQWAGGVAALWTMAVALSYVWMRKQKWHSFPGTSRFSLAAHLGLLLLGCVIIGAAAMRRESSDSPIGWTHPQAWVSGLLFLSERTNLDSAAACLVFLLPFVILSRDHPAAIALALVWTAAFLAPLALSPGPIHRYYLPLAGYLLLNSLAVAKIAHQLLFRNQRASPTMAQPASQSGAVA